MWEKLKYYFNVKAGGTYSYHCVLNVYYLLPSEPRIPRLMLLITMFPCRTNNTEWETHAQVCFMPKSIAVIFH
jgi:hypothetical protein